MFVDEVVNELFRVGVLQLLLRDSGFLEKAFVFEVEGDADVGFGDVSFALC